MNLTKSINDEILLSFTLDTNADLAGSVQQLEDFEFELVNQEGEMAIFWSNNSNTYSLRDSIFKYQRFLPSYDAVYMHYRQLNSEIVGYDYDTFSFKRLW